MGRRKEEGPETGVHMDRGRDQRNGHKDRKWEAGDWERGRQTVFRVPNSCGFLIPIPPGEAPQVLPRESTYISVITPTSSSLSPK